MYLTIFDVVSYLFVVPFQVLAFHFVNILKSLCDVYLEIKINSLTKFYVFYLSPSELKGRIKIIIIQS